MSRPNKVTSKTRTVQIKYRHLVTISYPAQNPLAIAKRHLHRTPSPPTRSAGQCDGRVDGTWSRPTSRMNL